MTSSVTGSSLSTRERLKPSNLLGRLTERVDSYVTKCVETLIRIQQAPINPPSGPQDPPLSPRILRVSLAELDVLPERLSIEESIKKMEEYIAASPLSPEEHRTYACECAVLKARVQSAVDLLRAECSGFKGSQFPPVALTDHSLFGLGGSGYSQKAYQQDLNAIVFGVRSVDMLEDDPALKQSGDSGNAL